MFAEWNEGDLKSFLIEITAKIVNFKDDQGSRKLLVDLILDKAGQKGTGKWTGEAALDFGVPIPTITAAVDARILSSIKDIRVEAAKAYKTPMPKPLRSGKKKAIEQIREALYASKICSYAQGFDLLRRASQELEYGLKLAELARIWKGGCIIRAIFLDKIREAFSEESRACEPAARRRLSQGDPQAHRGLGSDRRLLDPTRHHRARDGRVARLLRHVPPCARPGVSDSGAARLLRRAHVRADRQQEGLVPHGVVEAEEVGLTPGLRPTPIPHPPGFCPTP